MEDGKRGGVVGAFVERGAIAPHRRPGDMVVTGIRVLDRSLVARGMSEFLGSLHISACLASPPERGEQGAATRPQVTPASALLEEELASKGRVEQFRDPENKRVLEIPFGESAEPKRCRVAVRPWRCLRLLCRRTK